MTAAAVWLRVSTGHQDSGNQVPHVERTRRSTIRADSARALLNYS